VKFLALIVALFLHSTLHSEELQTTEVYDPEKPQKEFYQSAPKPSPKEANKSYKPNEINSLFRYGIHSRFWSEVSQLSHSQAPDEQLIRFMDKKNYGAIEGIAKIKFEFVSYDINFFEDYFNKSSMGLMTNALAGGEAYNRISPKLRGYALWDVALFGNIYRKEPTLGESGWLAGLGSQVGIGRQKLVEGKALDFVDKTPIKDSTFYYIGADLQLGYLSQMSDRMRFTYKGSFLPTYFYSHFDDPSFSYGVKKGLTTLRWKTEFEQAYAFQPVKEGGMEVAGQVIGGQQPLPVNVLPRAWDSVHQIKAFPDFGSIFGIGAAWRLYNASRKVKLSLNGGFYGGYFGYGGRFDAYGFTLEAGSYGLEQTSQFQLKESRITYGSLGYSYVF
jgi:hypothetical protein